MRDPEKTTQPDTTDAEAQALAAAEVGYRRTTARADYEAPAEEPAQQVDTESGPTEPANEAPETNPEPDLSAQQPKPEQAIADQLAALKSQVQELKASSDNNPAVRKLHGEIGNINRTLKALQSASKKDAPANDELAAAVAKIQEQAKEFPEILGDVAQAMKVMHSRVTQAKDSEPEPEAADGQPIEEAPQSRYTTEQQVAIKSLDEVHPDRHQVTQSADYKQWFAALSPEIQTKVQNTWNPAVVSQHLTDFKKVVEARKSKQARLDAAVAPKGGAQKPGPTSLTNEQAAMRGYRKTAFRSF